MSVGGDVLLSGISPSSVMDTDPPHPHPSAIHVLMSGGTPRFLPRVNSKSNLENFSLTAEDHHHSLNSQLLSNSHLHDQIASEVDHSAYLGKQKHLFAHTPGTTYYQSWLMFNVSYKQLVFLLTFLFTAHWFNHGIFQTVLTSNHEHSTKSSSDGSSSSDDDGKSHDSHHTFNDTQRTLILTASLCGIVLFSPIIGYIARFRSPLKLLWIGYGIILLSTFISAFSKTSFAVMFCARFLSGIGDAIIIPIAAPLILYAAPPDRKSLTLSIFLSSIPLGYSLGFFISSEIFKSLPSIYAMDRPWQRFYCFETIFLIPVLVYSWWRVRGPDSLLSMAKHNKRTHSVWDILSNWLYMGIVAGHTIQGFGCCVLALIVMHQFESRDDSQNGSWKLNAVELWSLFMFLFGTTGILLGGLAVDFVHNQSVFMHKKKRKKKKKNHRISRTRTNNSNFSKRSGKVKSEKIKKSAMDALCSPTDEPRGGKGIHSPMNTHQMTSKVSPNLSPFPRSHTNPAPAMSHLAPMNPNYSPYGMGSNPSPNLTGTNSAGTATATETVTANSNQWSLTSDREYEYNGDNIKGRIQQYRRENKKNASWTPQGTARSSLMNLKRDQEEMKREKQRQRRRRQREKSDSPSSTQFEFKPTTNLHTIRVCFKKVIIPSSCASLLCVVILFIIDECTTSMNLWLFGFLALSAQILTFVQISALYTSMLWSIGTEWQAFACGIAEIGFHLAGDGIEPGLLPTVIIQQGLKLDVVELMVVIAVSTLIFVATWKFVDHEIWDITKNNAHSNMFDLMYREHTPSTSTMSAKSRTRTITPNPVDQDDVVQREVHFSDSYEDDGEYQYRDESETEDSATDGVSDFSASDWIPDYY